MNNLGGPVIEMLSVFIPCIFKLKGKSKTSAKKCTKSNFKDYLILFIIILLTFGLSYYVNTIEVAFSIIDMWIGLCFLMI